MPWHVGRLWLELVELLLPWSEHSLLWEKQQPAGAPPLYEGPWHPLVSFSVPQCPLASFNVLWHSLESLNVH